MPWALPSPLSPHSNGREIIIIIGQKYRKYIISQLFFSRRNIHRRCINHLIITESLNIDTIGIGLIWSIKPKVALSTKSFQCFIATEAVKVYSFLQCWTNFSYIFCSCFSFFRHCAIIENRNSQQKLKPLGRHRKQRYY